MNIFDNIQTSIGATPLVRLNTGDHRYVAEVLVKAECFNPLGSVKDRIGLAMINDAETRGMASPSHLLAAKPLPSKTLNLVKCS